MWNAGRSSSQRRRQPGWPNIHDAGLLKLNTPGDFGEPQNIEKPEYSCNSGGMLTPTEGIFTTFFRWARFILLTVFVVFDLIARAASNSANPDLIETLTNAAQVRQFASLERASICHVRLEGIVLWVSPVKDQLILQDESGGIAVKLDSYNQPKVCAGQEALIEGNCIANHKGITFGLLIDNDGVHASSEKSGTLFLSAGPHPIVLEWFNGPGSFDLNLDYLSPGGRRQRFPMPIFSAPNPV